MKALRYPVFRTTLPAALLLGLLVCFSHAPAAQTADGLFTAGTVAFSLQPDDLIRSAAIGGQLGYRMPRGVLLLGEYLYADKDFYYYDSSAKRWTMATGWPEVPSGSSSRSDWIFYRTRHIVGFALGGSGTPLATHTVAAGPLSRLGLYGAVGIMLSIISVSEAEETYPEFGKEAGASSIGESRVLFTTTFRGGIVYPAQSPIAGKLAYLVQLERNDDFGQEQYIRRNSLIFLGMTLQPGGFR
jgi:hypothetical protein